MCIGGAPSYRLEPGDPGYVNDPNFPPPTPIPSKSNRMSADIIPQSEENLKDWCDLQVSDLDAELATQIGMTDADRAAYLAANNTLLGLLNPILEKQKELDELRANLVLAERVQVPIIRTQIKRGKTASGCTPAIQTQLEWLADSQNFDPNTARPTIVVEALRGRVKITGKKPGFEAYNLYWRKKGGVEWILMAIRKRKFPYFDETPLAVAGTPEVREYMAIGVISDEEAGQPSEIKEVVYAG
jgi:hypothetical protein